MPLIEKIVSGGQTGADRAALDWVFENGITHGGWCPKGRWRRNRGFDVENEIDLFTAPAKDCRMSQKKKGPESNSLTVFFYFLQGSIADEQRTNHC